MNIGFWSCIILVIPFLIIGVLFAIFKEKAAKFAYPNGIRLKYENVSLTLSVGDGAKVQTAPSGNASNTIVKAGKTTKLIFFMLCTSVYKFRLNKIAARWPAKAVAQFYFY